MSRAHSFLWRISFNSLSTGAALAAATLLGATAAHAQLTTWTYDTSDLQYVLDNEGSPFWVDYPTPTPTVGTSPLFDGIKIFGTGPDDHAFSITGADYIPSPVVDPNYRGNQLIIHGTGTINGAAWQHPDDFIRTTFGIGFDFSGGSLDIYKVETSFFLYDGSGEFLIGVGSGLVDGLGSYAPGSYGVGFQFEDRFGSNYQTAQSMYWAVTFGYDWTGMAPTDTFNFSIPQNSIDIRVLPEPASVGLFGLGALATMARRRRTR